MSGIMTPITGENKKRTCYFFDSGEGFPLFLLIKLLYSLYTTADSLVTA